METVNPCQAITARIQKQICNRYRYLLKRSGDEGDRTPDLGIANAALSHLSYIPTRDRFHIKLAVSGQSKIYFGYIRIRPPGVTDIRFSGENL